MIFEGTLQKIFEEIVWGISQRLSEGISVEGISERIFGRPSEEIAGVISGGVGGIYFVRIHGGIFKWIQVRFY